VAGARRTALDFSLGRQLETLAKAFMGFHLRHIEYSTLRGYWQKPIIIANNRAGESGISCKDEAFLQGKALTLTLSRRERGLRFISRRERRLH
jgi:alpha-D-ribose 1-methylphosphonate 5-triphosphate synthase subunit PhnI